MSPPINWMSCREIARPSTVPPKRLVVEVSAWVNEPKISLSFSLGIPIPVSFTAISRLTSSGPIVWLVTPTNTSPVSVKLIAFPTRLMMTFRILVVSPRRDWGTSGSTWFTRSIPFTSAEKSIICKVSLSMSRSWKGWGFTSSLPASILEKSRMSLMRKSSESAEDWTTFWYSCCLLDSSVFRSSSVIPRMPFIGVLISWLMLARNSLLTRLALSAASLAIVSSTAPDSSREVIALKFLARLPSSSVSDASTLVLSRPTATSRVAAISCSIRFRIGEVTETIGISETKPAPKVMK